jgi:hypothetical protein
MGLLTMTTGKGRRIPRDAGVFDTAVGVFNSPDVVVG